jgi:hypothetical protein
LRTDIGRGRKGPEGKVLKERESAYERVPDEVGRVLRKSKIGARKKESYKFEEKQMNIYS